MTFAAVGACLAVSLGVLWVLIGPGGDGDAAVGGDAPGTAVTPAGYVVVTEPPKQYLTNLRNEQRWDGGYESETLPPSASGDFPADLSPAAGAAPPSPRPAAAGAVEFARPPGASSLPNRGLNERLFPSAVGESAVALLGSRDRRPTVVMDPPPAGGAHPAFTLPAGGVVRRVSLSANGRSVLVLTQTPRLFGRGGGARLSLSDADGTPVASAAGEDLWGEDDPFDSRNYSPFPEWERFWAGFDADGRVLTAGADHFTGWEVEPAAGGDENGEGEATLVPRFRVGGGPAFYWGPARLAWGRDWLAVREQTEADRVPNAHLTDRPAEHFVVLSAEDGSTLLRTGLPPDVGRRGRLVSLSPSWDGRTVAAGYRVPVTVGGDDYYTPLVLLVDVTTGGRTVLRPDQSSAEDAREARFDVDRPSAALSGLPFGVAAVLPDGRVAVRNPDPETRETFPLAPLDPATGRPGPLLGGADRDRRGADWAPLLAPRIDGGLATAGRVEPAGEGGGPDRIVYTVGFPAPDAIPDPADGVNDGPGRVYRVEVATDPPLHARGLANALAARVLQAGGRLGPGGHTLRVSVAPGPRTRGTVDGLPVGEDVTFCSAEWDWQLLDPAGRPVDAGTRLVQNNYVRQFWASSSTKNTTLFVETTATYVFPPDYIDRMYTQLLTHPAAITLSAGPKRGRDGLLRLPVGKTGYDGRGRR